MSSAIQPSRFRPLAGVAIEWAGGKQLFPSLEVPSHSTSGGSRVVVVAEVTLAALASQQQATLLAAAIKAVAISKLLIAVVKKRLPGWGGRRMPSVWRARRGSERLGQQLCR